MWHHLNHILHFHSTINPFLNRFKGDITKCKQMWAYPREALHWTCTPAQRNRKPVFLICALFFILMLSLSIFRFSSQFFVVYMCNHEALLLFYNQTLLSPSLSFWVVGCAVCGVTIARSNVSRMDPNRKILPSRAGRDLQVSHQEHGPGLT